MASDFRAVCDYVRPDKPFTIIFQASGDDHTTGQSPKSKLNNADIDSAGQKMRVALARAVSIPSKLNMQCRSQAILVWTEHNADFRLPLGL